MKAEPIRSCNRDNQPGPRESLVRLDVSVSVAQRSTSSCDTQTDNVIGAAGVPR